MSSTKFIFELEFRYTFVYCSHFQVLSFHDCYCGNLRFFRDSFWDSFWADCVFVCVCLCVCLSFPLSFIPLVLLFSSLAVSQREWSRIKWVYGRLFFSLNFDPGSWPFSVAACRYHANNSWVNLPSFCCSHSVGFCSRDSSDSFDSFSISFFF